MGRRLNKDHALTNTEKTRRFHDKAASIDVQMQEAFQEIDWERRRNAEKSLVDWVAAYCVDGLLLDDIPPQRGCDVLNEMDNALRGHKNYCILMSRGSGKTSYVECATMFAMATGLQKFTVIISANARAAGNMMQDIWRLVQETDTAFAQDYPEICKPFHIAGGSFRRRQLYKGKSTEISKNAQQLVFARLRDDNGKELPTSGSIIAVRGVSSGIRGLKKGTLRPSLVLLDDLQDSESAENPQQVEKMLNIIRKDVMCLGGKQRLSILQTATPICPEDLVEHIKADKNWKTTTYPGIIKFPKNAELWEEYFKLYDRELVADDPHTESLDFYRSNRAQMDEGAEVFNPTRYSEKDGHISALQKMLELRHMIGNSAFAAEYQMQPMKYSYSLDITPKVVLKRINGFQRYQIPDGYALVVASTDLNFSYAMTTTILAFKTDMTAIVVDHFITPVKIDTKLSETEYSQSVFNALVKLGNELKSYGLPINGWGVDGSGAPFDAVTLFAKQSMALCGVPCCAMLGRASHVFNPFVRSRLRNEISRTVLCGDAMEKIRSGSGKKYMFWDSDFYRETAQKAFLADVGSAGSCSLYSGSIDEHGEFAQQFCNERLRFIHHRQDGRSEYNWKSMEPHDYLDSTAQAFAVAASQGISGLNVLPVHQRKVQIRRRVVVV